MSENKLVLIKDHKLYPSKDLQNKLQVKTILPVERINVEIVGKKPKLLTMIVSIILVILLALFLTGFGYQPWWLFVIVLILGLVITLPACFNPYWIIDGQKITITSYSSNDLKKLWQLLNLSKKDEKQIKFSEIDNAEIVYKKIVRISPFDFNPDRLVLTLTLKNKEIIELDLENGNFKELVAIISMLNKNEIDVYDQQQIIYLLSKDKNLFKHFHQKWATI